MNQIPVVSSKNQHAINQSINDESQSSQTEVARQIPEEAIADVRGKHIAQRVVSQWLNYGDPKEWDFEFEKEVLGAVNLIKDNILKAKHIIFHFETARFRIAFVRKNQDAALFGLRRDNLNAELKTVCSTVMNRQHGAYGYALERAVNIPYDEKYFVESQSDNGKLWSEQCFYSKGAKSFLRYGLVNGYIDDKPIPLTQYIFCRRGDYKCKVSEEFFGNSDKDYIGDNNESGIWLHPDIKQIPIVYKHIESLIDKAISGDLSVIPNIHWWYVHLAPTCRGSGGIAEMITNSLCRLHDLDLPPWQDGVAPSIETLLEPDEEKYCAHYHELFADNQEQLKMRFQKTN